MAFKNFHELRRRILVPLALIITCSCYPILSGAPAQAQEPQSGEGTAAKVQRIAAPETEDEFFRTIYRNFYEKYRLGPQDEIAIRVQGQPDYSLDRVKVSPVGRIYHPLAGEIEVAGMTMTQLKESLTRNFGEYIVNPKVSVTLEQAQSSKLGVLGEVKAPGIVLMSTPMTILDVISASGGFLETASRSEVTVLRQTRDGRPLKLKVNLKNILAGKADPEDNLMMQTGDTVIVGSNTRKKLSNVMGLLGFANFLAFIAMGRY